MSGLAEILCKSGYEVTGSDLKLSRLTDKLTGLGIKVYENHKAEDIDGAELLVYNARIRKDNPELVRASECGIPIIDRATLLGYLSDRYPKSMGISGTHGKTTTTSMAAMILLEAGLDPTIHIGGELQAIGGTTRTGSGEFFVTEADEYSASFLKLHNYVAVILNIEFDHPDFYRDQEHVKATFLNYAQNVPEDGFVVGCSDDPAVVDILGKAGRNIVTYGFGIGESIPDWTAKNICFDENGSTSFDLIHSGETVVHINMMVPGRHNIYNAMAAAAACTLMGCSAEHVRKALEVFRGAGRRFESKGYYNGAKIVDDYAHHPSEIRATLAGARNMRHKKLWCVFQPHTYTRTASLLNEFAASFEDADEVIIADIFSATENNTGSINSRTLSERIAATGKKPVYLESFEAIVDHLAARVQPGDMVMTIGAGDIFAVGEMLAARS